MHPEALYIRASATRRVVFALRASVGAQNTTHNCMPSTLTGGEHNTNTTHTAPLAHRAKLYIVMRGLLIAVSPPRFKDVGRRRGGATDSGVVGGLRELGFGVDPVVVLPSDFVDSVALPATAAAVAAAAAAAAETIRPTAFNVVFRIGPRDLLRASLRDRRRTFLRSAPLRTFLRGLHRCLLRTFLRDRRRHFGRQSLQRVRLNHRALIIC
mmetsp:Transcript_11021/g.45750  ORF Transcript_11021/g.45750 Transcript_11021/m.45750 type:complete len:211 (-) Transcript_11021:1698-2330(-)